MSATIEARLARFAQDARPGDAALAVMRLSLLDWAACGIAGAGEPVSVLLRRRYAAGGAAAVFGGGHADPERAALINGATSHALDYDDTHFAHIGHASVAVLPAVLAIAQTVGASGSALLRAALFGCEAAVRTGLWLGRDHYQTGFHQTATAGAFGAVLGVAHLLALSPVQTVAALGLAATRASGLKSQFGTMGKPYNAGLAAETGVAAARLAQDGMTAPDTGMSGPQGFGPTHHGAGDLRGLDGLGEVWLFEGVSHKFHACCHGLHAMLEAMPESGTGQNPEDVSSVVIATHARWLNVCNIAAPATGLEAKFSYAQTAAMRLAGIDTAAIGNFSDAIANRPDLVALRGRVQVIAADLPETASRVTITRGGITQDYVHDLAAPAPLAARTAKVRAKAGALIGQGRAERLWTAISADDLAGINSAFDQDDMS